MSWITDALSKVLKRSTHPSTNGVVVPQGYNTDSGEWIPVRVGPNGELLTTLTGGITVDTLTATTVGIDQETENANEVVVKSGSITLTGSNMELYGASVDDRPEATDVAVGTTFTIVDNTQEFKTWMSNGVDWGEEI